MNAERERVESFGRLEDGLRQASDWYHWGPYLSERQWGTVREDYSAGRHGVGVPPARPRALARLPLGRGRPRRLLATSSSGSASALALWNGARPDPQGADLRPDRATQGNHGEDAKEYWWYLDALPSHAWNRWRYHYPQARVPLRRPGRRERAGAASSTRSTSCSTPGAFDDDRYWIVEVDYAKADPHDLLMTVRVTNAGPEADDAARAADRLVPQHVVVGRRRRAAAGAARRAARRASSTEHPFLGDAWSCVGPTGDAARCCSATTRRTPSACSAARRTSAVPEGRDQRPRRRRAPTTVDPDGAGTKAAFWYQLTVAAGRDRDRARPAAAGGATVADPWRDFDDGAAASGSPRRTSSTPS